MNNKIEPHYVDFNTAKWLKEKGFDVPTLSFYVIEENEYGELKEFIQNPNDNFPSLDDNTLFDTLASAPEQWQVVEWLFDKHDIDVSVYGKLPYIVFPDSEHGEGELQWHFEYRIIQNKDGQKCEVIEPKDWFDSKKEAYSAAFDYVLNNLI